MKVGYFILLLAFCSALHAQIKFDVKVSDKHLKKVEQSKDARDKLKAYKKYYEKDSIKLVKKEWQRYKKQYKDTLKLQGRWKEAKERQLEILRNEWDPLKAEMDKYSIDLDSIQLPDPKDSLGWALRELALQEDWDRLRGMYEQYGQFDSTYLKKFRLDSIRLDSLDLVERFKLKERISEYLPEELKEEIDTDIAGQLKNGVIDEFGQIQKIDKSGVKEFFKNVDPEQFAKAQLEMKALKEKYAVLPNLEKEEEGIKRKSLEGTPWKKRIYLGGNFTIQSTDPIILDIDIRPGYRINKLWSVGAGFIWREQFNDRDSTSVTGDAHGYSFFTTYDVLDSFFATIEFQSVRNQPIIGERPVEVTWEYAYLAGIGKTFRFSKKVSATVSLLYDFNFKNNNLNARPLTFRFGYKIGK